MNRTKHIVVSAAALLAALFVVACSEDLSQTVLPLDPATSDPTTAVYYASNRAGRYEIFALRDTLSTKLIQDKAYDFWWPRISPDGKRLLYYRSPVQNKVNDFTTAELWESDASGANASRLIALADHNWVAQGMASWSPDGKRMVMSAWEKGVGWGLFIADSMGRNPVRITHRTAPCVDPSFSPDGSRIVYCTYPPGVTGTDVSRYEITTIIVDGSGEARLTTDSLRDAYPVWSPDNSEIVFATLTDSVYQNVGRWSIRAVKPDGTGLRTVLDDGAINVVPRWDRNSSHVIFQRLVLVTSGFQYRVVRMARDGTGVERLTTGGGNFDDTAPDPIVQ